MTQSRSTFASEPDPTADEEAEEGGEENDEEEEKVQARFEEGKYLNRCRK